MTISANTWPERGSTVSIVSIVASIISQRPGKPVELKRRETRNRTDAKALAQTSRRRKVWLLVVCHPLQYRARIWMAKASCQIDAIESGGLRIRLTVDAGYRCLASLVGNISLAIPC